MPRGRHGFERGHGRGWHGAGVRALLAGVRRARGAREGSGSRDMERPPYGAVGLQGQQAERTMTKGELHGLLFEAHALIGTRRSRLIDQIRGLVDDNTLVEVAKAYSRWDATLN